MGRLEVRICGARNIGDTRRAGIPDPYVKAVMGDRKKTRRKYTTKVVGSSLHPVWNEVVKFPVADEDSEQIIFELWNNNVIVDDLMGVYSLSVNSLTRGVVSDMWVTLKGTGLSSAELHLQVLAVDFGADPQPSSMLVRSIEECKAAAATKPVMAAAEIQKATCADDFDSVQNPSFSGPAMGILLQAPVAPPPQPLLPSIYNQQPAYVQQAKPYPLQPAPPVMYLQPPTLPPQVVYQHHAQPPHQPTYYQQAPPQGSYYRAPQQPYQYMYGPSPI
ncbi:putative c2 domain protein [Leishmania mexicana MHOM/GT/2001/U1103]|uniref:C2 domain protein n=1 Tax=Leishmania mexicana (strain MHOM/GT/2001/U1103) TaxID=929439 RepID=E9B1N0_LEIMU|nr:putative c2 domain protein [Leishmania mexicana MHOM/GT/2001/U1103]CBZ29136.1 putative c2 domain protein [Leishmania mexicana MHOM/GT/2001/U1103]